MLVLKRKINRWLLKLEHGDWEAIAKASGLTARGISRAFKARRMAPKTLKEVEKYFENKPPRR